MSENETEFEPTNGPTDEEQVIMNAEKTIADAVRTILETVGEDPTRQGLLDTPMRVARAYKELLQGYNQDISSVVNGALFDVEYGKGEMVIVEDITYESMCEHHMLPFSGKAHVAYIPSEKIIGLSKIPRIVEMFARRLQVQERLTNQVADAIEEVLAPEGIMVVFEGEHLCAAHRGIKKKGMNMRTSAIRGSFKENTALKSEFYSIIRK